MFGCGGGIGFFPHIWSLFALSGFDVKVKITAQLLHVKWGGWLGCCLHAASWCWQVWHRPCVRSEESHRKPPLQGLNLWLKARQGCMCVNLLPAKNEKVSQLSPPQTPTTFPLSLVFQLKIGWQRDCGVSSWSREEPVAIETNEPLSSTCLASLLTDFFPSGAWCGVMEEPSSLPHHPGCHHCLPREEEGKEDSRHAGKGVWV